MSHENNRFMRKIVLIALSLFAFLSLKATGLTGDWIYIDGEEWTLLGEANRVRFFVICAVDGFSP